MAEDTSENIKGSPPPKIRLNGDVPGGAPAETPKDPKASPPPPKVRSKMPPHLQHTAHMDFPAPRVGRAKIGKPAQVQKSTARIDLPSSAKTMTPQQIEELSKRATVRITTPIEVEPSAPAEKQGAAAQATAPIEVEPAAPAEKQDTAAQAAPPTEASPIQPLSDAEKEEAAKKATVPIETPSELQPIPDSKDPDLAKKTTARVIVCEVRPKGDTTRIDAAAAEAAVADASKKRTSRIDLGEVLEGNQEEEKEGEEDVFKRRTTVMDEDKVEAPKGLPQAIRIKKSDVPPTTQMPPFPSLPQDVVVPVSQAEAARKSETARIDLPPQVAQQPPTRRKTIRIKRPGAGPGSKPLVITRAPAGAGGSAPGAKPRVVEEDSPLYAWIALAAALVVVVLVYVLAAQVGTIAELTPARFPYPGLL